MNAEELAAARLEMIALIEADKRALVEPARAAMALLVNKGDAE